MSAHFIELLDLLRRRSLRMASAVEDMLDEACTAAIGADHGLARRVIARDSEIDAEEVAIEAEVIRLITLFQPMASDMRLLTTVLKVNSDLERIADCAVNIAQRARHLEDASMAGNTADVKQLAEGARDMLRNAIRAYADQDAAAARRQIDQDAAVDAFYGQLIRKLAGEATRSPEMINTYLDVLSIAKNLERIADHATNIDEDVIFLGTGEIVRHNRK